MDRDPDPDHPTNNPTTKGFRRSTPNGIRTRAATLRGIPDVAAANVSGQDGRDFEVFWTWRMSTSRTIQGGRGIFAVSACAHPRRSVESFLPSLPMLGDRRPPHEATTGRCSDSGSWAALVVSTGI